MRKVTLIASLILSLSAYSQELNVEMGLVPTYQINVTDSEVIVATTYPINVFIDEVKHEINTSGIFRIKIEGKVERVFVTPII